jgi:hypothetical protein
MTHTKITITPVTANLQDLANIMANTRHPGVARFIHRKWHQLFAITSSMEIGRIIHECRGAA